MILANVIQSAFGPLIDVFKAILVEAHTILGGSWGWSIIGLTIVIRLVDAAADDQAVQEHGDHAEARARAEGHPAALQG